jgi:fatty-acyl-CoA synthase
MCARPSYLCGEGGPPLLGVTIGECFRRTAEREAGRLALVSRHQRIRWTYAELAAAVERCARALLALGIARGDRVGIWSPNRAEWTVLQFATAAIGAILVNINPAYRAGELEHVLRHAGIRLLVYAPGTRRVDYREILESLIPELSANPGPGPLRLAGFPELQYLVSLAPAPSPGALTWAALLERADRVAPEALASVSERLQFDDPINIQYTSGTTGRPKGATLSHHNILNNGYFVGLRMGLTREDRLCIPVPLYHCFGMVLGNLACVSHGAAMVYPSEVFDARATLEAVHEERCTALHGVPTMFIAELEHPEFGAFDLRSLRTGLVAGSPCPIEVMRRIHGEMHLTEIENAYGMTETSPVSFQGLADDPIERRVETVGTVLPHLECKIIDPATGEVVPEGEPGELCTRGYSVMLGYWEDPGATAEAIDAARWMHTGDLATMRDGYVNVVGRLKDLIIRGGENIYPREIEEFLHRHAEVADVYVIGVPCRRYGEAIMAWVRLVPGAAISGDELREHCRQHIAHYKVPRYVKLVEEFPMTVTGKIQKFEMRRIAIEELGLHDEVLPTA